MNYEIIRALRALGMDEATIKRSATNTQTYNFSAPAGISTQSLQVPGTGTVLLGIIVDVDDAGSRSDFFNLKLNNETLMQSQSQLQTDSRSMAVAKMGYFGSMRRLTGRDTLTVDYNSVAGNNVRFTIVYLTNYSSSMRK